MELNEKLARWAGLLVLSPDVTPTNRWEMWTYEKGRSWDNDTGDYVNLGWIDFTSSLDACFKHLVPKLGGVRVSIGHMADNPNALVKVWTSPIYHWYEAEDPSPALALCKAIEQLIDEETDGS